MPVGISMSGKTWSVVAFAATTLFGCGSSSDNEQQMPFASGGFANGGTPGSGGIVANGGVPASGGTVANGGALTNGGAAPAGGTPAVGGSPATGGVTSAGGVPPATGAVPGSGGLPGTGGTVGTGGVPPDPANTVHLAMDAFTVAPGAEVYMCQNYDNPFGGQDVGLSRVATDMSKGSHHLHIFYGATSTNRKIESCSGTEFHPLLHASGKPHGEEDYTNGMAAKLKGSMGLRLQVHYLNTTPDPINVGVTADLTKVADPSTITKWVAELYFNRVQLSVPPGEGAKVTTSCTVPQGPQVGLLGGGSHMHSRGIHFVATGPTGQTLMDTTQWDEPDPMTYDPPVMLNPGDKITWECTYNNTTGKTLTFGESAAENEMCIYLARYYSNPNGDQMECQSVSTAGASRYRDPSSPF
jgi:hypothetical protein